MQRYSSVEQQAETIALTMSTVRWMPLPPTFAIRSYSANAWRQLPRAIAHYKWRDNRTSSLSAAELLAEARARAEKTIQRPPGERIEVVSAGFDYRHWWTRWLPA